jgi:hypothetical protein
MYKVYFSNPNFRDIAAILETEDEAIQFAMNLGALYLEADKDHPGCFDGIDKRGRVLCIEPTEFRLTA